MTVLIKANEISKSLFYGTVLQVCVVHLNHSAEKLLPLLLPYARTPFLTLYGKNYKFWV